MTAPAPIVVFDLDVTLTRYDTFLPFVVGYVRRARRRRALAAWRLLPVVFAFWRWRDHTWIKHRVLQAFLGGEPRERIDAWVERFCNRLMARAMRPAGLERLRRHQAEGARVVLASASFDIYVHRLAACLEIDDVLATGSRWSASDRLLGMADKNCRHAEKLRRVKALPGIPQNGLNVTAYSDSHADIPLLEWAEHGIAVCPSKRLLHEVGGLGLDIARW